MTVILSILNRFKIFFHRKIPLVNLQLKGYQKSHRTLHMLLHYLGKTLMSEKQAINDKLQGSVATYLRCGGALNNQIKKGLLLSLRVKIIFNR